MKLKVLKCPECRGDIEIEPGMQFCYCKYCGCKILLDEEKQEITINKNINISKSVNKTTRIIDDAAVIKEKSEARGRVASYIVLAVVIIAVIAYFTFCDVGGFRAAKQASDAEELRLQEIVDEVLIDIENGNFDEAYVKANSLYYTENWSSDIEEKWDATRESLLEQIKDAERESQGKRSILDWFRQGG